MTRRSEIDAVLQELYDQVPSIPDCQGKCWVSCGPASWTARELQRARERGFRITSLDEARRVQQESGGAFWCDALTAQGRCGLYDARPMACRLWGAMQSMPCPFGCTPERWVSDAEALELETRARAVSGGDAEITPANIGELLAFMRTDPGTQGVYKAMLRRGRAGVQQRIAGVTVDGELVLPAEVQARRQRGEG